MSSQFRYLQTYEQMVSGLLKLFPEDEAVSHAVGGNYEHFGVLEHALLRAHGLTPESSVVDVGCGSGRLASQLSRYPGLRYVGTDVVPQLLDYARRKVGRPDFRFEPADSIRLPVPDGEADFVVFFSVFTHLLHEESYTYLQEAYRTLRPGGQVLFSFLEFAVLAAWPVFEGNLDWVRKRHLAGHLNVFMHRSDLRIWAERLGFNVVAFRSGDRPFIKVDAESATAAVPAGGYALGQSLCVLRRPLPGEAVEPAHAQREERQAGRLRNRPAGPARQALQRPLTAVEREARRQPRATIAGEAKEAGPGKQLRPGAALFKRDRPQD